MSNPVNPAPAINRPALFERVDDDWGLLQTLLEIFESQERKHLDAVEDAFARQDLSDIARSVHGLASSLGTLASTGAFTTAREVERLAREGVADALPEAHVRLKQEYATFRAAIDALAVECRERTGSAH